MGPDHQSNYYWKKKPGKVDSEDVETPEPLIAEPDEAQPENTDESIDEQPAETDAVEEEPVHWSANEYIHHSKSPMWFVLFVLVVLVLIALDIFLIRSYTFSVLVVVMSVALVLYSRRPPRTIDYTLSGAQGLYVGDRLYHFNGFKAFGLVKDDSNYSILLLPIKRFAPGISVYFTEEVGEKIVDILGARLPMENLKLDIIDVLVRKLRL